MKHSYVYMLVAQNDVIKMFSWIFEYFWRGLPTSIKVLYDHTHYLNIPRYTVTSWTSTYARTGMTVCFQYSLSKTARREYLLAGVNDKINDWSKLEHDIPRDAFTLRLGFLAIHQSFPLLIREYIYIYYISNSITGHKAGMYIDKREICDVFFCFFLLLKRKLLEAQCA